MYTHRVMANLLVLHGPTICLLLFAMSSQVTTYVDHQIVVNSTGTLSSGSVMLNNATTTGFVITLSSADSAGLQDRNASRQTENTSASTAVKNFSSNVDSITTTKLDNSSMHAEIVSNETTTTLLVNNNPNVDIIASQGYSADAQEVHGGSSSSDQEFIAGGSSSSSDEDHHHHIGSAKLGHIFNVTNGTAISVEPNYSGIPSDAVKKCTKELNISQIACATVALEKAAQGGKGSSTMNVCQAEYDSLLCSVDAVCKCNYAYTHALELEAKKVMKSALPQCDQDFKKLQYMNKDRCIKTNTIMVIIVLLVISFFACIAGYFCVCRGDDSGGAAHLPKTSNTTAKSGI